MSRRCSVCSHQGRDDIDQALVRGQGMRGVAGRFGVSASAIQRHASRHIRPAIKLAVQQYEGLRIGGLAARLAVLADTAEAVRLSAMQSGDAAIVLRSLDSERALIADLMRILGHDAESVRAELAEAEALAVALLALTRRDPHLTELLAGELDRAGTTAANDLADTFRHLESTRPKPSLTAIPVAGD